MRAAEQDIIFIALVIRQGERRILQKIDVSIYQPRFAARALALLATVHERHALAEGGIEDRFALFNLHLDSNRLESHRVYGFARHYSLLSVDCLIAIDT